MNTPTERVNPILKSGTPFKKMTRRQKIVFVAEVVICVCTFGFAFPNVMER